MNKQFSTILEEVAKYEQKELGIVSVALAVLLVTIFAIAISKRKAFTFTNKVIFILIICTLCIVMLVYIIHWISYQNKLQMDISNQQYVLYEGEFTHDDFQKDSFYHNIHILDDCKNKLLLRYPNYGNNYNAYSNSTQLPIGVFVGTIVYAENSKIVVSWSITP